MPYFSLTLTHPQNLSMCTNMSESNPEMKTFSMLNYYETLGPKLSLRFNKMSFGENLCFRLGCDEIDAYSYNDFIKMLLFLAFLIISD